MRYLCIDKNKILKLILNVQAGEAWAGFIWFRIETSGRLCQHGNEPLRFHKMWKIWPAEQLLPSLKKDSVPQSFPVWVLDPNQYYTYT